MRRLAFRELLPPTTARRRVVLLGADRTLVRAAEAAGMGATVVDHLGAPGTADLVVVLADAPLPAVADVVRELSDQGAVWWETDRRHRSSRSLSPTRVAQRLQRHGLEVTDTYLIRPEPSRAEWFVPLRHPHALRWFVDGLYTPNTAIQKIGELLLRAMTQLRPRPIARLAPFHAVAARRPNTSAPVQTSPTSLAADEAAPDRCALLVHGGDRVVVMGFSDDSVSPLFVAKVATSDSAVGSLAKEHMTTMAVREHAGELLATAIPRPIALVETPSVALVQEAMAGRTLARSISLPHHGFAGKAAELRAVVCWVTDMHARGLDGSETWDDSRVAIVSERLNTFAKRFELSAIEQDVIASTIDRANRLRGTRIPRVWEHGDLTLWNVLIDRGRVRVIDWEGASVGTPLCDVLRITDQWHAAMLGAIRPADRATVRSWIVRPPATPSPATRVVREAIDGYVDHLGLPPALEDVLHVACLADLAVRQDERRRRINAASTDRINNAPAAQFAALAGVLAVRGSAQGEI
jgi:aminoglycoside phosphotransferase (APT) family kinase protein